MKGFFKSNVISFPVESKGNGFVAAFDGDEILPSFLSELERLFDKYGIESLQVSEVDKMLIGYSHKPNDDIRFGISGVRIKGQGWKPNPVLTPEQQIIEDKLRLGVNGLEWLVLTNQFNQERFVNRLESLEIRAQIAKADILEIMKYVVNHSVDEFYLKYQLNYWTIAETTIDFMTQLKNRNYNDYLYKLEYFYG